ncbi:MAG TPA: transglycosylase family protein [Acidimicrobiia bacterium]|nr:transglycosylase family protein [Acidimicrobiia bacterium]
MSPEPPGPHPGQRPAYGPRHVRRPHRLSRRHLVSEQVKPSPARAEPHDATSWLPLPDLDSLPALDDMVRAWSDPEGRAHPAESKPSPARAEPHDPGAWLPLPADLDGLPSVEELLTREPWAARPSPARAEPADAATWLPLPSDLDALPAIDQLVAPAPAPVDGAEAPGADAGTPAPDADATGSRTGVPQLVSSTPPPTPVARPTRRMPAWLPRPSLRVLALSALVVVTLGGIVAVLPRIIDQGANVDVRVDGRVVSAQTGVGTVGAFLRERHVHVGPHDRVVPSPASSISDGLHVIVARGFPITVDLDGNQRTVWTTYHAPADFIAKDLKPGKNVVLRANPTRLERGSLVVLRTKHKGTLVVDGQTVHYDAPAIDLDELLHQYSVQLRDSDFVACNAQTATLDQHLVDGATCTVMRVGEATEQHTEDYMAPAVTLPDPTRAVGDNRTVPGTPGKEVVTEVVTQLNGVDTGRTVVSKVPIVESVPTIHYYGTRADAMWDRIAQCETGGNWGFVGPEFSGGLGFFNGTWDAFGGRKYAPNAGLATREQQILVAMEIQRKVGLSGWGCARKLGYVK